MFTTFAGSQRSLCTVHCCITCLAVGTAIQNGTWADSCPAHGAAESAVVGGGHNWDIDDATSVLQISGEVTAVNRSASRAPASESVAAPPLLGMIELFVPPMHATPSLPGIVDVMAMASRGNETLATTAQSTSAHVLSHSSSQAFSTPAVSQPAKARGQAREHSPMLGHEGKNGSLPEQGWWAQLSTLASQKSAGEAISFTVHAATLYSAVRRASGASTISDDGTWLFMLFLVLVSLAGACFLVRGRSSDNERRERRGHYTPGFHTSPCLIPRGSIQGGMAGRAQTGRLPINNDGIRRSSLTLEPKAPPSMDDLYSRMQPLSPRLMSRLSLTPSRMAHTLRISDPSDQSLHGNLESFFAIPAIQLPADCGSIGEFDILRGSSRKAILHGSVQFTDAGLRWVGLSTPGKSGLLASCWPSPGSCPIVDGREVEPCAEVQICNKAGDIWGTLSPKFQDSYGIYKGDSRVLTLAGDRPAGRLAIFLDSEPLAHAARGRTGEYLEIGIKPPCDPILMLICLLAVVVLNPEQDG